MTKKLIFNNYWKLRNSIDTAKKHGQNVKLLAVSKKQPKEKITCLYNLGHKDFGENYIQEARRKANELPQDLKWHLIGPIQKNKIKYCPKIFSTIHSLSDINVTIEINKRYLNINKKVECFIQMNLSEEKTKNGLTSKDQLFYFVDEISKLENINLTGLMTMPDPSFDNKKTIKVYQKLNRLKNELATFVGYRYKIIELSMGMTNDYQIAIAEGATIIRIGTALFGQRNN